MWILLSSSLNIKLESALEKPLWGHGINCYCMEDFLISLKKDGLITLYNTCKERLSIAPASQNGTKAKYPKRRPASYLQGNKKEKEKKMGSMKYIKMIQSAQMKPRCKQITYHQLFQRLSYPEVWRHQKKMLVSKVLLRVTIQDSRLGMNTW